MPEVGGHADRVQAEACGPRYDRLMMLEARRRSLEAMRRVASQVAPGMAEADAVALMREELRAGGMLRGWHGIKVRFGVNTLLTFGEPAQPGVVHGANDVFSSTSGPSGATGKRTSARHSRSARTRR